MNDFYVEETISTLNFASRASSIVNTVKINHSDEVQDVNSMKKEIHSLRQQVDDLQMKYKILSASTLNQLSSSSSSSSSCVCCNNQDILSSDSYQVLIETIDILSTSLKHFLITCLQEEVILNDDELLSIQENIHKMYKDIQNIIFHDDQSKSLDNVEPKSNNTTEDLVNDDIIDIDNLDLEFMPPIVSLIEQINKLKSLFASQILEKQTKLLMGTNNDESIDNDDLIQDAVANEAMVEQGIHLKQQEIAQMLELTTKVR